MPSAQKIWVEVWFLTEERGASRLESFTARSSSSAIHRPSHSPLRRSARPRVGSRASTGLRMSAAATTTIAPVGRHRHHPSQHRSDALSSHGFVRLGRRSVHRVREDLESASVSPCAAGGMPRRTLVSRQSSGPDQLGVGYRRSTYPQSQYNYPVRHGCGAPKQALPSDGYLEIRASGSWGLPRFGE
jgi:hypothetical protein